jgi:8-oxo-dGTP pyrophosphatase MutT (NUDIX family)
MSRQSTLVAVGVLRVDGRLAMIQFKRNELAGYWGMPGGKIHEGESLPEALKREFQEEVEIEVNYKSLLGIVDETIITQGGNKHYLMMVCSVEPVGKTTQQKIEHEEGSVDWFTPIQIKNMKSQIVPSDYEMTTRIALGKERGYFHSRLDMASQPPKLLEFR